jgi:hypothetical protein
MDSRKASQSKPTRVTRQVTVAMLSKNVLAMSMRYEIGS